MREKKKTAADFFLLLLPFVSRPERSNVTRDMSVKGEENSECLERLRQYKISPASGAHLLFALIIAPVLVWSGNKLENQTAGSSALFFAEHINPTAAFLITWRSALSNCHDFPELPNGSGVQISSTLQHSHTLKC